MHDKISQACFSSSDVKAFLGLVIFWMKIGFSIEDHSFINYVSQSLTFFTTYVCCVFQPALRCLQHLKARWNIFLAVFQPSFHFKAFSVISLLKATKNVWKWTKNVVLSTPQSWSTCIIFLFIFRRFLFFFKWTKMAEIHDICHLKIANTVQVSQKPNHSTSLCDIIGDKGLFMN